MNVKKKKIPGTMLAVSHTGHKDSPSALIKSYVFICKSDMLVYKVTIHIFLKNICFSDLAHGDIRPPVHWKVKLNSIG